MSRLFKRDPGYLIRAFSAFSLKLIFPGALAQSLQRTAPLL
jgi:hypothetical protein